MKQMNICRFSGDITSNCLMVELGCVKQFQFMHIFPMLVLFNVYSALPTDFSSVYVLIMFILCFNVHFILFLFIQ